MSIDTQSQEIFKRLKTVCVPLLGTSLLSPTSIPIVSKLLTELVNVLRDLKASNLVLTPSLISYTFFPLSTILRRNKASDIPDQVLEKLFVVLGLLCQDWWWDCDLAIWEQIFMLCGAVIGGIEGKGKGKDRDDETKEAAAQCLLAILRQRNVEDELPRSMLPPGGAQARLDELQAYSRTDKFIPVLGQTLNSLLGTVESHHLRLQQLSLELLSLFVETYAPEDLIPTVLPGVISCMSKVSLGTSRSKGWANGAIVAGALKVMQSVIVRSLGDDICIKEGALHYAVDLQDLAQRTEPNVNAQNRETRPYTTLRTASWLRGTSSQLLIAMNTLTPLVSHPTPSALLALSDFSLAVLNATPLTLPDAQALLLSFLLSLTLSGFLSVSGRARTCLLQLLKTPSAAQHSLLQALMRSTRDNLAALPRLLPAHEDAKVEHVTGLIEAVCRLATTDGQETGLISISTGIGKLLGPTGGIERWGWSLLSVLELVEPPVTVSRTPSAQLMLEGNPDASQWAGFPEVSFRNVFSSSTRDGLERMFRALGHAGGDSCLFSVEWFVSVGRNRTRSRSVAAIWCACRLLEGIAGISLVEEISGDSTIHRRSKRLEKLAHSLARSVSELWDDTDGEDRTDILPNDRGNSDDPGPLVQHMKGVSSIHETLHIVRASPVKDNANTPQPTLHKVLSLQLLAVSAAILQARFTPLFIYTLYPVLHSLVSPVMHLSSTALATLNFITIVTSHASPANLLLSNFDYALDAVSRRLGRRWLDVDATKVLALMVRLVGSDIVERAGDVVEECFDRLDEFHGYGVVVEGLIEVLGEVVKVVETGESRSDQVGSPLKPAGTGGHRSLDEFFHWLPDRHKSPSHETDDTDYGPAPHKAWGESTGNDTAKEDVDEDKLVSQEPDPNADPPPTPIQALTKQIVSRSLYFLTHSSPVIRARILALLSSSVPVLPESAILPSIHTAWPFILNRLADSESFVVSAAASLVEALVTHVGSFMFRRIWDDVWPRFRVLLGTLDAAEGKNALSRRGYGAVGTESAYTHSHRLYRSLIKTMAAAMKGVHPHDTSVWQVIIAFRRFLHVGAHEELQRCAVELYLAISTDNADAVWLALSSTAGDAFPAMQFLRASQLDIEANMTTICQVMAL